VDQQTSAAGQFRPIGTEGFGETRQQPRAFDQQPLEATATIAACFAAWRADHDVEWKAEAARVFAWFLGSNDLSVSLVDLETGSCRDGLIPDRPNENRGGESVVSYLLGLSEIRQVARLGESRAKRRLWSLDPPPHSLSPEPTRTLVAIPYLNRQALYLRPDPTRVIVRPFKPATEPRDLNSEDKTAPIILSNGVLSLDSATAAAQLADVLENFLGRHRNLLQAFELRAEEMEEALATTPRSPGAAQLVGLTFSTSIRLKPQPCSIQASSPIRISRHADGSLRFVLASRSRRGAVSSLTFRSGSIASNGTVKVDPRPACLKPRYRQAFIRARRR